MVLVIWVTLAVVLTAGASASAVNGPLDGNAHPNVGVMLVIDANGDALEFCGGVLISPTVFLTNYNCPRAVAFEPRFACGVAWGANHDWRDVQKRRLEKEGDFPVPHYWAHVRWVWGARDMDEFMRIAENVHLDGVLERIRVPFLVTHGEKDSQIPLKWAHRTYEQLVNSPKRELKIFTEREGGVQHSSFDNSINAGQYIADWVAETLGGRTT